MNEIIAYCNQHIKDVVKFDGYDGGVYDTCWDILEIIKTAQKEDTEPSH